MPFDTLYVYWTNQFPKLPPLSFTRTPVTSSLTSTPAQISCKQILPHWRNRLLTHSNLRAITLIFIIFYNSIHQSTLYTAIHPIVLFCSTIYIYYVISFSALSILIIALFHQYCHHINLLIT